MMACAAAATAATAAAAAAPCVDLPRHSSNRNLVSCTARFGYSAPKAASLGCTVEPALASASRRAVTLYDILGIEQDVPDLEVKEAYRRLAKVYHPDVAPPERWPEQQTKFLEVQRAYDVLKDPETRAVYDCRLQQDKWALKGEWRGYNWETDQCW